MCGDGLPALPHARPNVLRRGALALSPSLSLDQATASREEMRRERERLKAELAERDQHLRQMREAMANVESRRDAAHAEVEAKHATEVSRLETSVLRERINASVARAVLLREVRACEEEAAAAYQAATLAAVKEGTTWQKSQGEGVVEDNLNHLSDWMTVGTRPEVAPERARQSLIERLVRASRQSMGPHLCKCLQLSDPSYIV